MKNKIVRLCGARKSFLFFKKKNGSLGCRMQTYIVKGLRNTILTRPFKYCGRPPFNPASLKNVLLINNGNFSAMWAKVRGHVALVPSRRQSWGLHAFEIGPKTGILQPSLRITTSALDFCSYPYICSLSQDLESALDLNSALDSSCYSYNWFLFWDSGIALDFASASDFRSHSYVYSLSQDFASALDLGFALDFYSYICPFSQDWGSAFLCQYPHGSASLRKILKCTALVRLKWGKLSEKNGTFWDITFIKISVGAIKKLNTNTSVGQILY